MKFSATSFQHLGSQLTIGKDDDSKMLDDRTFVAFFGMSPEIIAESWSLIHDNLDGTARPKHLLWTCMFMKLYLPEDVMCVLLATSKPTFRKWVWIFIENLALTSLQIVSRLQP